MIRSHVIFVCGKRGGGKSYTMGVIAEGMADLSPNIKQNLSNVMLDTMGIYWTMKYPNIKEKDLLDTWEMQPKGLDVIIYTPAGFYNKAKEEGIPTDYPFSIRPSELLGSDWNTTFGIPQESSRGRCACWRLCKSHCRQPRPNQCERRHGRTCSSGHSWEPGRNSGIPGRYTKK